MLTIGGQMIINMEILGLIYLPVWLVVILVIVFSLCLYTWYKQTLYIRHGIKQKPTTFLLGDLPLLSKKGLVYLDAEMVKQNGKVFGSYIGNMPSLIIADTDMIKQIMVKDFPKFTDRVALIPVGKKFKSAVTIAAGDHWKFLRSTLSPTFSSGKMRNMAPYINRCLKNFMEIIAEKQQTQSDEGFDITPIIRGYTMDVICSTGFGLDVNSQKDPNNPFIEHAKAFLELDVARNPVFVLLFMFPDLGKIVSKLLTLPLIAKEPFEFFENATKTAFAERKKEKSKHKDLLQLMINANKSKEIGGETNEPNEEISNDNLTFDDYKKRGLTDQEVFTNSMIFMVAGYDTTATALCWLAYDLSVNPEVQEKLIQEIDSEVGQERPNYDNAFKLKYLEMVVQETLRMHPPAVRVNRQPSEDVDVCGVKIKKGWDCTVPIYALHFMPEYWKEPTNYNPERFAPENQADINPYAYLPFGTGPRNCIGMRLALLEVKVTLITLLQKYRILRSPKLKVPMPINRTGLNKAAEPIFVKLEVRN